MSQNTKKYTCWSAQFGFGGAAYGFLEILWRGYTHFSMLIAGGVCFWLLIRVSKSKMALPVRILLGGFCITVVEFLTGCVVNLWLVMDVWDYSRRALSIARPDLHSICTAVDVSVLSYHSGLPQDG